MNHITLIFTVWILSGFLIFSSNLRAIDKNGPHLIVYDQHQSGMFAVFTSVLGALDMYETDHFSGIKVDLKGLYSDPNKGPNWWEYYFEPINIGNDDPSTPNYVISFHEMGVVISRGFGIGPIRANELINRYIRIKPEIKKNISKYAKKNNFKKNYMIGVHYRGTDKWSECPLVPYEIIANKVDEIKKNLILKKKNLKIFIATDQSDFITFMEARFPREVIYNHFPRSENGTPLHVSDHLFSSNFEKGLQALTDCVLLSLCDVLIRSPNSSLSVTSGRFNLKQKQVIVRANDEDKSKDTY